MGEVSGDETEDTGSASQCFLRNAKRFRLFSLRNGSHEREACQVGAEFWNAYSDGANEQGEELRCFQRDKKNI